MDSLTHERQEFLIRRWLLAENTSDKITDGIVDQAENRVNSVITYNKIVPRYPFYVLSIMQTQEDFMPSDLDITSYGHCYYALVIANLIKAGISRSGGELDACFNFAEHLAYEIFSRDHKKPIELDAFIDQYKVEFFIPNSTLNRMKNTEYGIISSEGKFNTTFSYLFFLGRYLARNIGEHKQQVESICERAHIGSNDMILLFIIHHTSDEAIIEDILLRTMCTLDGVPAAELNKEETQRFFEVVSQLRAEVVPRENVAAERQEQRHRRDDAEKAEAIEEDKGGQEREDRRGEEIYRVLRSNQLLGQIIRNKFGALRRKRIGEIVEVIADAGLRLVNTALVDEEEIRSKIEAIARKYPKYRKERMERMIRGMLFIRTILNLELIVHSVNVPEVRQVVAEVVRRRETPAYDLLGFFNLLDSVEELSQEVRQKLEEVWRKYDDVFVRQVLALRTVSYMNTHRSPAKIEQAVCEVIGVRYRVRAMR